MQVLSLFSALHSIYSVPQNYAGGNNCRRLCPLSLWHLVIHCGKQDGALSIKFNVLLEGFKFLLLLSRSVASIGVVRSNCERISIVYLQTMNYNLTGISRVIHAHMVFSS